MLRRRLLAAALLIGIAHLATAPRAAAAPFTGRFADLIAELSARDLALPDSGLTKDQKRERAILAKAFQELAVKSQDLAGDLKMARKMAATLEAGYPADATIGSLLTDLDDALASDVATVRNEVVTTLSLAAPGKLHDRAQAKLDAADALLADAAAAATQALRARFEERGHAAVLKANALAVKAGGTGPTGDSTMTATVSGSPWAANPDFGTAVSGSADVSAATGGVRKITVVGRQVLPSSADPRVAGDSSQIRITFLSNPSDIVAGTYAVGTVGGVYSSGTWISENEDGSGVQAVAIDGTLQITSMTVREGSIDVEGTFSFTMYDGIAATTFPVVSGSFKAFDLARFNVP